MKLGWIGLGAMGNPMAFNLIKAGFALNIYNRTSSKIQNLKSLGANSFDNIKELVKNSEIIFLMLSNGESVREVLTSKNGILDSLSENKIIVDMSTISPLDSKEFYSLVKEKNCDYIDAPVSGSIGAAIAKQLIILVGGEEKAKEICKPYFEALGRATIDFGENSNGTSAKLSINMLLGVFTQAMAESITFSQKLGLDKEKVFEMISLSGMNTPLFQAKKESFSRNEFPSAFALELMSKDLGLLKQMIDNCNLNLPLSEISNETYLKAKEQGFGKEDMAAVIKTVKENNK
ncbi:NAD(P)-dependent oxidoreductase [Aliarcobacter butzleri]|uniref:NAD(P)-dependent oxidoreductase n=1 Tax=Aliarcobacter butzleri TaxID=28197 RepID=UPI001EDA90A1|nr:NAD(P)-dependent oxidoreductase [Aliarcobacter butzleri]MCG3710690.1 NAD(P)-dependent oxidoreductase [Aliarcobacter butzleri]MCG3714677.1 NAD(P)-dependent oxidoreductase [Aliarcobacter butzleri]MCT7555127.1 NAD(P)-dependent oxidoreductase [Aliarcobacter butzleri]MDK2084137.1 NAD(P)-dependent oxidoreductase [Aliarcobacter butzleri]MDN5062408.1 NAD(P)-dependent oxidoreductase [Aliarcobacter butzleri]